VSGGGGGSNQFPIDICFCLDATGSMQPWLSTAKAQIKYIVKELKAKIEVKYPSLGLVFNVGILAFRDYCDQKQFEDFHFKNVDSNAKNEDQNSIANFERVLDSIQAYGGGDLPEDILGALNRVVTEETWSKGWKSKVKFLVLITDSSAHGTEFSNSSAHGTEFSNSSAVFDSYPNGSINGLKAENIMKKLCEKNIEFVLSSILNETKKMAAVFQKHYDDNENNKKMLHVNMISESSVKQLGAIRKHYIFLLVSVNYRVT
jgi:hypothetical protein